MTGIIHIVVARKPIEGTIAENCLKHGCGAINVDACRIETDWSNEKSVRIGHKDKTTNSDGVIDWSDWNSKQMHAEPHEGGRWPANLILDESAEVQEKFPDSEPSGSAKSRKPTSKKDNQGSQTSYTLGKREAFIVYPSDSGSASRFFFNFAEQESTE